MSTDFKVRVFPYGYNYPIDLTLEKVKSANSPTTIVINSFDLDPSKAAYFKALLTGSIGYHGHLITEETTPIDLAMAVSPWNPEIVSGEQLIAEYETSLPLGVRG